MQHFGRQILAGATLAGEQDGRPRTGGNLLQQGMECDDGLVDADDPVESVMASAAVSASRTR